MKHPAAEWDSAWVQPAHMHKVKIGSDGHQPNLTLQFEMPDVVLLLSDILWLLTQINDMYVQIKQFKVCDWNVTQNLKLCL